MYKHFHFRAGQPVTIELIKRMYHKLALENHPDRVGDLRTMQEINDEFATLKKKYYNVHEGQNGGVYRDEKQEAPTSVDDGFIELIDALLKLDGVGIEICGSFVWLSGNTFEHKAAIKALGFRWASKKKMWFLAPDNWSKKGREWDMGEIRMKHGSQVVREGKATTRKRKSYKTIAA